MTTLFTGMKKFIDDMGATHGPIALWASLFPFPQIFVGGYLAVTRGVATPGALIFAARVASFFIAGQVSLHRPFWKMHGPIMHTPFLVALPLCYYWLGTTDAVADRFMYFFIAYTSVITSISMVLDANTAIQWASGQDPGLYKRVAKINRIPHEAILPVPSLLIALAAYYFGQ